MAPRVPISKRLVMINSIATLLQRLIGIGVLVWLQRFLFLNLTPEEFAAYGVVLALMVLIPLLGMVVGSGLGRFITEAYAQGSEERVTRLISTMFPLCVATGAVLLLVGGGLAYWGVPYLAKSPELIPDMRLMLGILVVSAALRVSFSPFGTGLQVHQKFVWVNLLGLGTELLRVALIATLLLGVGPRALWVVVATFIPNILGLAANCWLSRRIMPSLKFRRSEFRAELVRPLMQFGGWNVLARVSSSVRTAVSRLFLNHFLLPVHFNSFRMGAMVESRIFPTLLAPLGTVQTALTAMSATGQQDRLRGSFLRLCRFVLWAFLAVSVPLIVYRHELWQAYLATADFEIQREAALVMALFLGKSVFVFPQPVLAQIAMAKGDNKAMAIRVAVVELTALAALFYGLYFRDVGAVGAAAISVAVQAVLHPTLNWSLGLRLTDTSWALWVRETLWPGLLPGLLAAPLAVAMHTTWPPGDLWTLGLQLGLTVLMYVSFLWIFGFRHGDRADAREALARLRLRRRAA